MFLVHWFSFPQEVFEEKVFSKRFLQLLENANKDQNILHVEKVWRSGIYYFATCDRYIFFISYQYFLKVFFVSYRFKCIKTNNKNKGISKIIQLGKTCFADNFPSTDLAKSIE